MRVKSEAVSQVVIVHPGGLGDVLLALPAIRALRATYPNSKLLLVGSLAIGELLKACSEIDDLISLEDRTLSVLLTGDVHERDALCKKLSGADLAVCWMNDMEGQLTHALHTLGVREVIAQSPFQVTDSLQHQSARFLASVGYVANPVGHYTPLRLPSDIRKAGRGTIGELPESGAKTIALHPGSGSRHKCVEPSTFGHLANVMSAAGCQPIVVGGPADDWSLLAIREHLDRNIPIVHKMDLRSIAGLLAHVDLFVGHDSGLTHLASAMHRPTVAIFGPTSAERWAPGGVHVRIVRGEVCRCDGWEEVQSCHKKPCLQVPARTILEACETLLEHDFDCPKLPINRGASPCSAR